MCRRRAVLPTVPMVVESADVREYVWAGSKASKRRPGKLLKQVRFALWPTVGRAAMLCVAVSLAFAPTTLAQQQKPPETKSQSPAAKDAPRPAPPAAQQKLMPVSIEQAIYLIRSTLLTLNDANRSGNYTVLRDLAAPGFQTSNTAADLSQIFSDLRRRNFDLYGAALLAPQLTAVPALDQNGMLRLTGYIPTQPLQINFDLLFQAVNNQWRLFGISVATPETASGRPQAQAAPEPPKQGTPAPKRP